ncbi:hypothetical protein [Gilliamella apicola]|nr:hypothetical protein [Gilliamella apicola]
MKAKSKYLSQLEQGGTLNIGTGLNPIAGAYNISPSAYPMAAGPSWRCQ